MVTLICVSGLRGKRKLRTLIGTAAAGESCLVVGIDCEIAKNENSLTPWALGMRGLRPDRQRNL
jgi:hypothetical protein